MLARRILFTALAGTLLGSAAARAAAVVETSPPATRAQLEQQFTETVRPFLQTYCLACHGKDKPKGQLDLSAFTDLPSVVAGIRRWEPVLEMLGSGEMPPAKAQQHPSAQRGAQVVAWIGAVRRHEAGRNAGDPGPVLARRLSNAEYDYTIRDLTGVDIRPTAEFPVDPANEAGFDNSGESLVMSPALLKKYLDAARTVAEHLVLEPRGIRLRPPPRCHRHRSRQVRRRSHRQLLPAAAHRPGRLLPRRLALPAPGRPGPTAGQPRRLRRRGAGERQLPAHRLVGAGETPEQIGPLAKLQGMFRALPAPPGEERRARRARGRMRDFVDLPCGRRWPHLPEPAHKGVGEGSQPFVLWKNSQRATHRTAFDRAALYVPGPPAPRPDRPRDRQGRGWRWCMSVVADLLPQLVHDSTLPVPFAVHELGDTFAPPDPELAIPDEAQRARYQAAFARFCQLFPDAFYVSERGRAYLDKPKERQEKGRLLSAGYHNMFGFFRDDLPLYQRILDPGGRRELDQPVARAGLHHPWRPCGSTPTSSSTNGQSPRPSRGRPSISSARRTRAPPPAMIRRLAKVYLAQARESLRTAAAMPTPSRCWSASSARSRRTSAGSSGERRAAEPSHLTALLAFAGRAYRRPLTGAERASLLGFYRSQRRDGPTTKSALRDTLARVLMSPHYLYRRRPASPAPASDRRPWTATRWPAASATSCGRACPTMSCWRTPRAAICDRPVGADRAGAPHAARRPGAVAGGGVRRAMAGLPALRGAQRRRPPAVPQLRRQASPGHVRGAGAVLPGRDPRGSPGAGFPLRPPHLRQPGLARHYGMRRRHRGEGGCGWTTPIATSAAASCPWRCSSPRTPPACAPARSSAATGWCAGCWASTSRRRPPRCRTCPATSARWAT